jgi:ABC-type transport system substrate-binding protein
MNNKSRWFIISAILIVIGLLSVGCAKETAAPTSDQPVTTTEEAVPTEEIAPVDATEKSQIVIVIAEDPPSFNATVGQTGFDSLVMELVMLSMADLDEEGNAFPELAAELPTVENGDVVIDEEN